MLRTRRTKEAGVWLRVSEGRRAPPLDLPVHLDGQRLSLVDARERSAPDSPDASPTGTCWDQVQVSYPTEVAKPASKFTSRVN